MNLERIDISKIKGIETSEEELLDLEDFLIDPKKEVPAPIPILSVKDQYGDIPIFTEDNISMIQGKAKSRKSTLLKAIAIAINKGEYGLLVSHYPRNRICIFDTEQSKYHCWRSAKIISHVSGRNIHYYSVAGVSTENKKKLVETYLKRNPDCGFLILDNIVHFLTDFNSSTESADLNQWLIKTKSNFNTHICLVLHENGSDPGNGKAKGHIGTLLENTCESIIRVEKDRDNKDISIVKPKAMRGREFEDFTIQQDYQGVPYIKVYSPVQKERRKY